MRGNNEKALRANERTIAIVSIGAFFMLQGLHKSLFKKAFKNSVTDYRKQQSPSKIAAVYVWWLTATRNSI
jgi:hypothetical protein